MLYRPARSNAPDPGAVRLAPPFPAVERNEDTHGKRGRDSINRDFSEVSTPSAASSEKAKFICYPGTPGPRRGTPRAAVLPEPHRPSTWRRRWKFEEQPTVQTTTGIRYAHTDPICLSIGELWFDTYDTRKSVREEYIDALETLVDYDPHTHYPNIIVFVFGEDSPSAQHHVVYTFFLSKLSVDYTMFLPDGTPVKARSACA
ncbi:MAG: hypothetical protein U1F43_19340 [Myxococcota bacterium]